MSPLMQSWVYFFFFYFLLHGTFCKDGLLFFLNGGTASRVKCGKSEATPPTPHPPLLSNTARRVSVFCFMGRYCVPNMKHEI